MWPDVHVEHLQVHEMGETFAEVTEGNPWPIGYVWERLRYDWSEPGVVKGTVTDSNIFEPGSTWKIRATPTNSVSRVDVIGVRHLRGLKGRLLAPAFPLGAGQTYCRRPPSALPRQGRGIGRWEGVMAHGRSRPQAAVRGQRPLRSLRALLGGWMSVKAP